MPSKQKALHVARWHTEQRRMTDPKRDYRALTDKELADALDRAKTKYTALLREAAQRLRRTNDEQRTRVS